MFEIAACPLCYSPQVQLCTDANNPAKDYCRCRHCKCTGPYSLWQKQAQFQQYVEALEIFYSHVCVHMQVAPDCAFMPRNEWVDHGAVDNVILRGDHAEGAEASRNS